MDEASIETKALQATRFFAGLPDEDLQGILRAGRSVSFEPGQAIVTEGDVGDAMYIVLEGEAQVDVGGRFHKLAQGDFFGEMALVSQQRRIATVKASAPVKALEITAEELRSFLMDHPGVALSMLKAVVDRLREVEQRLDAWMA